MFRTFTIRGQEPVHYIIDVFVRPVLVRFAKMNGRFRFAVIRLADDILVELDENKARISNEAIAQFASAEYSYNRPDMDAKLPIEQRLSGQGLPFLDPFIEQCKSIVEIGSANGSISALLADKYTEKQFIGIDFYVPQISRPNLRFVKGYALDVMPACDCVFMQFTAVKMMPLELDAYFRMFSEKGIRHVVLSEPVRTAFLHRTGYMRGRMWSHDYQAVCERHGYQVVKYDRHHVSQLIEPRFVRTRTDTHIIRLAAVRASSAPPTP